MWFYHISIQIYIWDHYLNELDYMVDIGIYGFWGPISFKAPQLEIIFFGSFSKATGKVSLRQGHGSYLSLVAWMLVSRFHIASSRGTCVAKLSITSWWDQLQSNAEKKRLRFIVCENEVVRDLLKRSLGNEVEMLLLSLTLQRTPPKNPAVLPWFHIGFQSVLNMYISSDKMSTGRTV